MGQGWEFSLELCSASFSHAHVYGSSLTALRSFASLDLSPHFYTDGLNSILESSLGCPMGNSNSEVQIFDLTFQDYC